MFTGLVQEVGRVRSGPSAGASSQLKLFAPLIASGLQQGESVAVNGCCLTATEIAGGEVSFDLLAETLARTNLGVLRADRLVNLERALTVSGRFGGHFVQGHVDCTARVLKFQRRNTDHRLEVELPEDFAHYVAFKGSIALNGVSLTIAEVLPRSFTVWIIPHTFKQTNLRCLGAGDLVNLEFDLLAKYVERIAKIARSTGHKRKR